MANTEMEYGVISLFPLLQGKMRMRVVLAQKMVIFFHHLPTKLAEWLPTKLAEWIGENLQDELGFPDKADQRAVVGSGWTVQS